MFTVEEYLRFAQLCEQAAREATAPKQRETMLVLAGIWYERAKERKERDRAEQAA